VSPESRGIDWIGVSFDEPSLVADAGLIVPATLMVRLGLEALVNQMVHLGGRVGGSRPRRKVLTMVTAITAPASHIDHADRLRAGATQRVLPFRVMAPYLRAQKSSQNRCAPSLVAGGGAGRSPVTMDLASTICEVHGKLTQRAAYGYTRVLGYHPLIATWAKTGEVLHARLRKESSQRGHTGFVSELIARVRWAGATGALNLPGFFSNALIDTMVRLGVAYSITLNINAQVRVCIEAINESAWHTIAYPDAGVVQVAETTLVTGQEAWQRTPAASDRAPLSTGRSAPGVPCGPSGVITPSSPMSPSTPSPPVPSTAPMPASSSPSATSKRERDSSTAPSGHFFANAARLACAVLPTISFAGAPSLATSIPTIS